MAYKTITVPFGTAIIAADGDWVMICATDDEAHEYIENLEEAENAGKNVQQAL